MKRENWTKARWQREAWRVFSLYIRKRDNYTCFTCGRKCVGAGAHAGHYAPQSVSNMESRFNPDFVHCQCYSCNIHKSGNHIEYRRRLCELLGDVKVEHFENHYKRVSTGPQWQISDFQSLIEKYKNL